MKGNHFFSMRILIITACTGAKVHKPENRLTRSDFEKKDSDFFKNREKDLSEFRLPAAEMYSGLQHVFLRKGLALLRKSCPGIHFDMKIVSAAYGLLGEDSSIVPYEMTFSGMKAKELRKWSDFLELPKKMRSALKGYDAVLFLLGKEYLRAAALTKGIEKDRAKADFAGTWIFISGKGGEPYIPKGDGIHSLFLANADAKRMGAALVSLKGRVVEIIGEAAGEKGEAFVQNLFRKPEELLHFIRTCKKNKKIPDRKKNFPSPEKKSASEKKNDHSVNIAEYEKRIIRLPVSWKNSPHREKMRYFIPDWDDLVNPAYDFLNDIHPDGSGDAYEYAHYAHQIYDRPPYDGILISKVIVEAKKNKKKILQQLGVHRYLRVPREFPIMGDCGAFGYIMEKEPPYETGEILNYYRDMDFDYGVSIDHLIVNAVLKKDIFYLINADGERREVSSEKFHKLMKSGRAVEVTCPKFQRDLFDKRPRLWKTETGDDAEKYRRYELTIANAGEFIEKHRKGKYSFVPIGAAQGWSPESYADAVKEYQKMGYRYIALGGLVRTQTKGVMEVLESVAKVLKPDTDLHLFGVARPEALSEMQQMGVSSIDSASFLRRAWLGANSNYFTSEHKYAAIRIPQPEKSPKARKIVAAGKASLAEIQTLEKKCLDLLRAYDRGEADMEDVFAAVMTYDGLIEGRRTGHDRMIRKTLEDRPWQKCNCKICKESGVEVIIFRGNNRNRRRGFHNTDFFYRQFCEMFG
jgi:hypothetical protein